MKLNNKQIMEIPGRHQIPYQTKGLWTFKGQEPGCLQKSPATPQRKWSECICSPIGKGCGIAQAVRSTVCLTDVREEATNDKKPQMKSCSVFPGKLFVQYEPHSFELSVCGIFSLGSRMELGTNSSAKKNPGTMGWVQLPFASS